MKHFNFRLAVMNVCHVLVFAELLLSPHSPTSEGWTTELTVGLWLVVPATGIEPTRVNLTRFGALRLNSSVTKSRTEKFKNRYVLKSSPRFPLKGSVHKCTSSNWEALLWKRN